MVTPKEIILEALKRYRGDDLERAESRFRAFSDDQMKMEWGQSGSTPAEILARLRQKRREIEEVEDLVRRTLPD